MSKRGKRSRAEAAAPVEAPPPVHTPAAPGRPALPLGRAARAVFDLALEGMVWSRRSLAVAAMLALPVVLAIVFRIVLRSEARVRITPEDFYGAVVTFYYLRFALPIAALFYATALIADEVDGKTLAFLITRPVRRGAILLGKFAAYVVTTLALALPAAVATFFLLATAGGWSGVGGRVSDLFRDAGVMALALLAYGGLFTLFGVLLRRPVIPGLLFIFIWEQLANLPGYMPYVTLTAWLRSLVRHRPPQEGLSEVFGQVLPAVQSLAVLGAATVGFVALALWIFSRREYVMEQ